MNIQKGVSASLFGKTARVIASNDKIEVYTTSTWFIILCVWIFAGAFFSISMLFKGIVISVVLTSLGTVAGFLLSTKLYIGKLTDSFNYNDIDCFILSGADFSISLKNTKLYVIRMLSKAQIKLINEISQHMEDSDFKLEKTHGKYRVKSKNDD